jgi:hypothetical protein
MAGIGSYWGTGNERFPKFYDRVQKDACPQGLHSYRHEPHIRVFCVFRGQFVLLFRTYLDQN